MLNLHNQKFGVEVEFTGIQRVHAIRILAQALNNTSTNTTDLKGRKWNIVSDCSVSCSNGGSSNELVTPPLTYEDMGLLQDVIRALKGAGATVNSSCGVHVHVEFKNHNFDSLLRLIKMYSSVEDDLYRACRVRGSRSNRWTKKLSVAHSNLINNIDEITNMSKLKYAWYRREVQNSSLGKYDSSRYCGLNLHNIWYKGANKGTIEFRLFNESLHAGKIRAYVIFVLLLSAQSKADISIHNYSFETFEDFLEHIGMFNSGLTKNPYDHFTKHLIAYRERQAMNNEELAMV